MDKLKELNKKYPAPNWALQEIKQLKKEKEWLLEGLADTIYSFIEPTQEGKRKIIIKQMKEALKEK